jgi:hypothetical protein
VATSEGGVPQLQEVEGGYDAPPDTALGPLHTSPVSDGWRTESKLWVAARCWPLSLASHAGYSWMCISHLMTVSSLVAANQLQGTVLQVPFCLAYFTP